VVKLPRTPAGTSLGGYIDESIPHCVNHIKVGNLGFLEVLLIACDDGDVLAYYTHTLLEELKRQDPHVQAPLSCATPFFHEHVKSSVWGLALRMYILQLSLPSNAGNLRVLYVCTSYVRNSRHYSAYSISIITSHTLPVLLNIPEILVNSASSRVNFKDLIGQGLENLRGLKFTTEMCGIIRRVMDRVCYIACSNLMKLTVCVYLDQQSRLIAVSTNLRRITIFAHGCTASPGQEIDHEERIREDIEAGVRGDQKFKTFLGDDIVRERLRNLVSCSYPASFLLFSSTLCIVHP